MATKQHNVSLTQEHDKRERVQCSALYIPAQGEYQGESSETRSHAKNVGHTGVGKTYSPISQTIKQQGMSDAPISLMTVGKE